MPAYNWFDLSASYVMNNGLRFTIGVNNITDEAPPLAPDHNDQDLHETYDPLGRYLFGSITFQF